MMANTVVSLKLSVCLTILAGVVMVILIMSGHKSSFSQTGVSGLKQAVFAGGCFWCMEPPFEKIEGVRSVTAGYTGGHTADPTYEEVCSGRTGHAEAVLVEYDPAVVRYENLLEVFWRNVDPTDTSGQFADKGSQYRTGIFYFDEEQRSLAEASKARLEKSGIFQSPIATEITPASEFYPAEEHHQDYYKKQTGHYKLYRAGSGREGFLKKTWEDQPFRICPLRKPSSSE